MSASSFMVSVVRGKLFLKAFPPVNRVADPPRSSTFTVKFTRLKSTFMLGGTSATVLASLLLPD